MSWKGICGLLDKVDHETACCMEKLEMPAIDTLLYMGSILKNIHCREETYLVIDNCQLISCDIFHELISVFSIHGNPNLHFIFITQPIEVKQRLTIHRAEIYKIDVSAFYFEKESIDILFRMDGIYLTEEVLEKVFSFTGGWISAICLQILNYKRNGTFDYTVDIERLVEHAIWNRLNPKEKTFLLSVSILDRFDTCQAAIMMGRNTLPDEIERLLKSNDFIRYDPVESVYMIHSIFQKYLQKRFYHSKPKKYRDTVFRLAGNACAAVSQYYTAAQFFYKIKDFDAILSLPVNGEYLINHKEMNINEFIHTFVYECSEEILCKHPFILLVLAYPMLLENKIEIYSRLCHAISYTIEHNPFGLEQNKLDKLKGEFLFLLSFTEQNSEKRTEKRKAALEILGGPSSIIINNMPWTFGGISILYMFWRESGRLKTSLSDMKKGLNYYIKLTNGHGAGADHALWAEMLFMQGKDDQAEILCYKALYEARNWKQTAICLCVEVVLARIAILRGDVNGYFTTINNIKGYAKTESDLSILRMVDLGLAVINLTLGVTDDIAKCFFDIESLRRTLYAPTIPYAQICYSYLLVMNKQDKIFYGIWEPIMAAAEQDHYIMPQVYYLIFLAVVERRNGNPVKAHSHLERSLSLALPDQIYIPFTQFPHMKEVLAELFLRHSSLKKEFAANVHALETLCSRQEQGVNKIKNAVIKDKSPLTPREREVARFAKKRWSAREIGEELHISESTVRTILKNVYSKLDIHSKAELKSIDI